ncbi:MAG: hypothetical protein ACI37S_04535 [Candidatus Gastranaerophilaceae bacterium]
MKETILTKNIIDYNEDIGAGLLRTIVLAKNDVPYSHKRIADNYVVIKRMYNFHAVKATVTLTEYDLLKKYDFMPLEGLTIQKVNEEIEFLKSSAFSDNLEIQADAEKIMLIRAKELKNITASAYANIPNEIYNGYKALDKYFEEITKFYK